MPPDRAAIDWAQANRARAHTEVRDLDAAERYWLPTVSLEIARDTAKPEHFCEVWRPIWCANP